MLIVDIGIVDGGQREGEPVDRGFWSEITTLNGALRGTRTPDTLVRSQVYQEQIIIKSAACDVTNLAVTA